MDINYLFVTLLVCLNQCTGYNVPRGPGPPPPPHHIQFRPEPSAPPRFGPGPSAPSRFGPELSAPSRYGPEQSPPPFLRPEARPAGYDPDIRPPPPPYGTIHQPWQSNNNYQEKPPWQQPPNNYGNRPSFQPPFAPNYQQNQIQTFNPQGRPSYPVPPLNNQGRPPYQGNNNPYQPLPPFNKPGLPYQPVNPVITTTPTPTKSTPKPIDVMADVTNELGAKILLDHVGIRKNFVFSPYGVSSVLAVLHEGSTGDSSRQLANVLNLPKEIETVRVGMRDLHRHLKSYFGHNGFLQGVDLSHNNTSLRADFVPYLRLYGFYVDDKGNQSTMMSITTTMEPATTMPPTTTMAATTTTEQTATTQQPTTETEDAEDSDMEGTNAQQLVQQVDEKPEKEKEPEESNMEEKPAEEKPVEEEEEKPTEETNTEEKPAEEAEEKPAEESNMEEKPAEESNMEEPVTEEAPDEVMQETTMQMVEETSMEPMEQDEEATTSASDDYEVTTEEGSRRKRATIHHSLFPDIELNNGIDSATKTPSPYSPNAQKRPFRLFSGESSSPVTVIEKKEILLFASLPQLRSVAVLLPLDEPRYGMLLLLPTDSRAQALKQLAQELTQSPLRNVLDALRPTRVQVTLPAFAADGTVILTSSLQKLGVWDIFDPRLARLNGMSNYAGLFIRDLEQHIHMDFGTVRSLHTRVVTARSAPEVMNAMRPFLYFVIDRETKIALMAGKIEDPSDSRVF